MRIDLKNWDGTDAGAIDWDPDRGAVDGVLSGEVRRLSEQAAAAGWVTSHPYPTRYAIGPAPLASARDFVLVLSTRWRIPEVLAEHFPPVAPTEPPPGAEN